MAHMGSSFQHGIVQYSTTWYMVRDKFKPRQMQQILRIKKHPPKQQPMKRTTPISMAMAAVASSCTTIVTINEWCHCHNWKASHGGVCDGQTSKPSPYLLRC